MSLYIIATPLGNLQDISQRALETLKSVDLVLAEDTRRTRQLLAHFKISKKIESWHAHSNDQKINQILKLLEQKQKVALVTDAGTPTIADPGAKLINQVYQLLPETAIIPIPGPSAITAALSVAGFPANSFCFWGYPPRKGTKRQSFFQNIAACAKTQIFFSTPHKILKDLADLKVQLDKKSQSRKILVAREMTKMFETLYRANIAEVTGQVKKDPLKGEYSIVVSSL